MVQEEGMAAIEWDVAIEEEVVLIWEQERRIAEEG